MRQVGTVPAGRLHLLLPGAPDEKDGAGHPGEDVGADAQVLRCPVCCKKIPRYYISRRWLGSNYDVAKQKANIYIFYKNHLVRKHIRQCVKGKNCCVCANKGKNFRNRASHFARTFICTCTQLGFACFPLPPLCLCFLLLI